MIKRKENVKGLRGIHIILWAVLYFFRKYKILTECFSFHNDDLFSQRWLAGVYWAKLMHGNYQNENCFTFIFSFVSLLPVIRQLQIGFLSGRSTEA